MNQHTEEAQHFLKICSEFKLGKLPTEMPNPKTVGLSDLSKNNLEEAINILYSIDREVFSEINKKRNEICEFSKTIKKVLNQNGRIFLVGCGATGRLSLALEMLWRRKYLKNQEMADKVISFMAGGDVALIHSIEKFEDFPEFGERQMMELGFNESDILIATTEGGETPFVIGATNKASTISLESPYFLYCNPDEILMNTTTRSKEVIQNQKIKKINLSVGPMALTGSTRMQATTILMFVVGLALLFIDKSEEEMLSEIDKMRKFLADNNLDFLKEFIEIESEIYQKNELILYETNRDLGLTILTDTTERSPTFSLHAFENQNDDIKIPSLSYLLFSNSSDGKMAWNDLLMRQPRCFYWPEVTDRTTLDRLYGFNFSSELLMLRRSYSNSTHYRFKIFYDEKMNSINFQLSNKQHQINCDQLSFLSVHLILKMALNIHSTLVMGRIGRYESNLMTWVRASNFKLIDRAVRFASILLLEKGIEANYEKLVLLCFEFKDTIPRDRPLVLYLVDKYQS
jgi:N-acetylmuramic acid 6-phosphate etherase